jgi:hypothetical protein
VVTGVVRRVSTMARAIPAGVRLLAEVPEQRGQLVRVERREQLRGRDAAARVEAHVERAAGPDAEAAVGIGQLEARQPQVEQQPVDRAEARVRGDVLELPEVRPAEDQPVAEPRPQPGVDSGDGRPVGVETEEAAIRRGRLQDPLGVPTAADRGVDLKAAGSRREHLDDLLRQHRLVPFLHLSSTTGRRIPSGPWKRMWCTPRSPAPGGPARACPGPPGSCR